MFFYYRVLYTLKFLFLSTCIINTDYTLLPLTILQCAPLCMSKCPRVLILTYYINLGCISNNINFMAMLFTVFTLNPKDSQNFFIKRLYILLISIKFINDFFINIPYYTVIYFSLYYLMIGYTIYSLCLKSGKFSIQNIKFNKARIIIAIYYILKQCCNINVDIKIDIIVFFIIFICWNIYNDRNVLDFTLQDVCKVLLYAIGSIVCFYINVYWFIHLILFSLLNRCFDRLFQDTKQPIVGQYFLKIRSFFECILLFSSINIFVMPIFIIDNDQNSLDDIAAIIRMLEKNKILEARICVRIYSFINTTEKECCKIMAKMVRSSTCLGITRTPERYVHFSTEDRSTIFGINWNLVVIVVLNFVLNQQDPSSDLFDFLHPH